MKQTQHRYKERNRNRLKTIHPVSNFVTALGLGQAILQAWALPRKAGQVCFKEKQTKLTSEKARSFEEQLTAPRRGGRRPATRSSWSLRDACWAPGLWRRPVPLQGGAHRGRLQDGEVPPADGQAEGPTHAQGAQVRGSTRSSKCVDELPARIWAAAPLWAGCWCQTPQLESLGRKVIRNSCTSRWFVLTLKKKCPVHRFEKIVSFFKYKPQKYLTEDLS